MEKFKPYLLWGLRIIVALLFVMASLGKLTQNERVIEMFENWGFFDGFYLIIGVLELAMAILLLIPKTSLYAAAGLFLVMIGALLTHLLNDPIANIIRPLVFMLFLAGIIRLQWKRKDKVLKPEH